MEATRRGFWASQAKVAMANTLRLFIAVELPEEVLRRLGEVLAGLRQQRLPGIRWVRPEGIHLTLKFLGGVEESRIPGIVLAMEKAVAGVRPFTLRMEDAGAFPNMRSPRVVWLGVNGDVAPLVGIQQRLEEALEAQGFERESRKFSAHLTLGRVNGRLTPREIEGLAAAMGQVQRMEAAEIPVNSISLMESTLRPDGAEYRMRAEAPVEQPS